MFHRKLDTTLEQLESNKQQLKELEKQLQCKAGELEEGREEDLKTRETALHKLHREVLWVVTRDSMGSFHAKFFTFLDFNMNK